MRKTTLLYYLLVLAAVSVILWAFYIPLLNAYFMSDDTQWIWFSATKSVREILFSPEDFRAISSSNFTPLLGLSFKLDWHLFGMNARGYNIHNLITVLVAGCVFFMFIRANFSFLVAGTGTILFFLNPVVLSVYAWSSTRHYLEGMICAALSLTLHASAYRKGKVSALSGLLYLLSLLSKEVYAPVPVVAFLMTWGARADRVRSIVPMCLAFFVYAPWRVWILGSVGGYPFVDMYNFKVFLYGLYKLVAFTPKHLLGNYSVLFPILAMVPMVAVRNRRGLITSGVILLSLLAPSLPVLSLFGESYDWARYILVPALFFIVACALCIEKGREQWKRAAGAALVVLLAALFALRDAQLKAIAGEQRKVSQASAEMFLTSGAEFMRAAQPWWFYEGLRDIWAHFYGKSISTVIVPDDSLLRYSPAGRIEDLRSRGFYGEGVAGLNVREQTIHGTIKLDRYRIQWNLGPHKEGTYALLYGSVHGLYTSRLPISRHGTYMFGRYYPDGRPLTLYLKILYESPEGWEGMSEEYRIEAPGTRSIELR